MNMFKSLPLDTRAIFISAASFCILGALFSFLPNADHRAIFASLGFFMGLGLLGADTINAARLKLQLHKRNDKNPYLFLLAVCQITLLYTAIFVVLDANLELDINLKIIVPIVIITMISSTILERRPDPEIAGEFDLGQHIAPTRTERKLYYLWPFVFILLPSVYITQFATESTNIQLLLTLLVISNSWFPPLYKRKFGANAGARRMYNLRLMLGATCLALGLLWSN